MLKLVFRLSDLEGTNTEENDSSVRQAGEGDVTSSPVPGDGGGGGDGSSGHGRCVHRKILLSLWLWMDLSNHNSLVVTFNYVSQYSRASLLRSLLLLGFGYKAVGHGPRFSATRGKCQMGLLKPT